MSQDPEPILTDAWGSEVSAAGEGPLLVDEADLALWLSAEFQAYPGCSTVSVASLIRLDAPDTQGCNWSRTLFLDSGGASPTDYAPAYAAIVEMARKAFNLKPAADPLAAPAPAAAA
jgi:hypothetical protein